MSVLMQRDRYRVSSIGVVVSGFAMTLLLSNPWVTEAEPPAGDSTLTPELEQAIERYIRAHPEVIKQSLQTLEVKREAEEKAKQKVALANRQQDLLHDPSSPVSGNHKATITLIEFFDYRCGHAASGGRSPCPCRL